MATGISYRLKRTRAKHESNSHGLSTNQRIDSKFPFHVIQSGQKKSIYAIASMDRKKKWVSYLYRTAQPSTLAVFLPWGIKQELVVQDLPAAKVGNIHELMFKLLKKQQIKKSGRISSTGFF